MFYKVLFLLTCYNLYKSGKSFVKENVIVKNENQADVATAAFISFGMTILFYVMVLALCFIPSLLF